MVAPLDAVAVPMDIDVRHAELGQGRMGLWDDHERIVWLDASLTSAERRSTLAHELVHAERGDLPCEDPVLDARQERRVEAEAARRLIPLAGLVEGARWTDDVGELAELLDVDPAMLRARLGALTARERRAVEGSAQAAP